jgi:hypothetical protein
VLTANFETVELQDSHKNNHVTAQEKNIAKKITMANIEGGDWTSSESMN